MNKILNKRILRDFKENFFRNLAIMILIIIGNYLVISTVGSAEIEIKDTNQFAKEYVIEDGQFSTYIPLTKSQLNDIEKMGFSVEKQFYLDYDNKEEDYTMRFFMLRKKHNLNYVEEGELPKADNEILLEKQFSKVHDMKVGDILTIKDMNFIVSGITVTPDYEAPKKELSDIAVDSRYFGTAFLTEEGYKALASKGNSSKAEVILYSYKMLKDGVTDKELKNYLTGIKVDADVIEDPYFVSYYERLTKESEDLREGINELSDGLKELKEETDGLIEDYLKVDIPIINSFVKKVDNTRIYSVVNDVIINKQVGLLAGVITMSLFAYVISVFIVYSIDKESMVIGALYSLGVKKKELLRHYMKMPVVITGLAGMIGTLLGTSDFALNRQFAEAYGYWSIRDFTSEVPLYLYAFGILVPVICSYIVTRIVINKRLNQTALSLLRNEKKQSSIREVNLGKMNFVRRFQIKQILKEMRTSLTVVGAMFICLLILMLGLDCYTMCINTSIDAKNDIKYEYMYTYKYPDKTVPDGGYEAYGKSFNKEVLGYKQDITLLGITEDNPFFDVELTDSKRELVISSALASKVGLKKGDSFVVTDEEENVDYAFVVADVTSYSPSMFVFMDIDVMRELFDVEDDYYNIVFADHDLEIETGKLFSTISRSDILKNSNVFINHMRPMVYTMIILSAVILCVVLFLMIKVMIDKSAMQISLFQVFGYGIKDVKKLYISGNFLTVFVGALVTIPLSKTVFDCIYPYCVSNVSCDINIVFPLWMYGAILLGILVIYFIVSKLIIFRINKIMPADILKNRE